MEEVVEAAAGCCDNLLGWMSLSLARFCICLSVGVFVSVSVCMSVLKRLHQKELPLPLNC